MNRGLIHPAKSCSRQGVQGGHLECAKLKHFVQAWLDAWMIRRDGIDLQTECNHSAPPPSPVQLCISAAVMRVAHECIQYTHTHTSSETLLCGPWRDLNLSVTVQTTRPDLKKHCHSCLFTSPASDIHTRCVCTCARNSLVMCRKNTPLGHKSAGTSHRLLLLLV